MLLEFALHPQYLGNRHRLVVIGLDMKAGCIWVAGQRDSKTLATGWGS